MSCANFPATQTSISRRKKFTAGAQEFAENESKKPSVNSARLCGELSYGTFLVAAQPHWGLIVLAFPGGEDGSRPERKKF